MFRHILLRSPLHRSLRKSPIRQYATEPPSPASSARIERFNRRLPRFLHKYTNALGNAPFTHITAFLLLHEITAIVPLLGLAATFHYTHWLPGWFAEGAWVLQGVERFGRYFRRKGWIRDGEKEEAEREVEAEVGKDEKKRDDSTGLRVRDRAWNIGEGGTRVVVEFATAYAITKMLLPLRIIFSVWGTPWFARVAVVPVMGVVKRVFGRGKPKVPPKPGAAGSGAVDAGVVPKPGIGKGNGS